ncbi:MULTISPECIES: hypothetical protein [unclassified Shewanella]|nr:MULTISPECIES: hypothetical protein [unclassified Shewanella]MCK7634356.1 hypothetical protein [Shewanella sp. JNE17]MCK7649644.1 hypothetical protein [Shewanella sp. JNE8]MCK7657785.1 hypothetical protein [Shewanella sp. JNE4-2]UPO29999.1 hypothetical protein MZ182_13340 [Shewanella sp. JNE2]
MNVLVNATALNHSGAKTILEQFMRHAAKNGRLIYMDKVSCIPSFPQKS